MQENRIAYIKAFELSMFTLAAALLLPGAVSLIAELAVRHGVDRYEGKLKAFVALGILNTMPFLIVWLLLYLAAYKHGLGMVHRRFKFVALPALAVSCAFVFLMEYNFNSAGYGSSTDVLVYFYLPVINFIAIMMGHLLSTD